MTGRFADVSKGIAVSSLGLYAGILSCSTMITTIAPVDVVKGRIAHVWCAFGIGAAALATISTAGFSFSYYVSPENAKDIISLFGLFVAPITGAMIYISTLLKFELPKKSIVPGLPPNHPNVIGENGEVKECPFHKGGERDSDQNDKVEKSSRPYHSTIFTPINTSLMITSTISVTSFIKIILSGFVKNQLY